MFKPLEDRRRYLRHWLDGEVVAHLRGLPPTPVLNLGLGGMLVEADRRLDRHDILALRIEAPGSVTVDVLARVVACRPSSHSPRPDVGFRATPHLVSISFELVDDDDRAQLAQILSEHSGLPLERAS